MGTFAGVLAGAETVTADFVVAEMRRTDSTEDEEFMADLEREIRQYPRWRLTRLDPRKSVNAASDDTVELYAESEADEFPPIIAIPEGTKGAYYPLDGSHRVAAALLRRDRTIEAWFPAT